MCSSELLNCVYYYVRAPEIVISTVVLPKPQSGSSDSQLQFTDAYTICYHSEDLPNLSWDAVSQGREGLNY